MYIIIVGGGKIGRFLAQRLSGDKHAVVIVDKDKSVCDEIAKDSDMLVIHGDGCDLKCLEDAGVSRANVIAAVTGDETILSYANWLRRGLMSVGPWPESTTPRTSILSRSSE
jgi:Trk K+ transport system NAD-binding subunit